MCNKNPKTCPFQGKTPHLPGRFWLSQWLKLISFTIFSYPLCSIYFLCHLLATLAFGLENAHYIRHSTWVLSLHSLRHVLATRATKHTLWARNHIFRLSFPWNTRKKRIFSGFRNFHFYAFYRHFSIFSLYNTSKFLVSSYRSQFFT